MHDPAQRRFIPFEFGNLGLKAGVVVEIVFLSDVATVLENFRRVRVFFFRDEVEFLAQRQIDVGLHVAGRARITVPVPGPAKVTTFLDEPQTLNAGLPQAGTDQQAAVEIVRKVTGDFDVLFVAVCPQSLVALFAVFGPQCLRIESEVLGIGRHGCSFCRR